LFGTFNAANRSTDLSIIDDAEVRVLRADLPGAVAFSWSPDSTQVAYRTLTREEGAGPLVVLDAGTGDEVARSSAGVLGFFWSPDSGRVAYLTLSPTQGSPSAQQPGEIVSAASDRSSLAAQNQVATLDWIIWDIATNAELRVARFVPTTEMIYLISYFDQFNQSHRLWSPDSRYLVYADETIGGQPTVNILDTTAPNAVPFAVARGRIGIWSYD
jgi:TolB protein